MQIFEDPQTWRVGDTLNAATLNERVRDQNAVLLRRPLTQAHSSVSQSIPHTSGVFPMTFDTIDNDDDGMVISTTPVSDFYVQRAGTYQVWLNVTASTLAAASDFTTGLLLDTAGVAVSRWVVATRFPGFSGQAFSHALTATLFLSVGETITPFCSNDNATTAVVIPFTNNTPTIQIMWMGTT